VLDVLVSEVVLQRAGVVAIVGKLEAAGMHEAHADGRRTASLQSCRGVG